MNSALDVLKFLEVQRTYCPDEHLPFLDHLINTLIISMALDQEDPQDTGPWSSYSQ